MDEEKKFVRVPFTLHRNNPKHQEVLSILEQVENKNAYIREAVLFLYQHKDDSVHEGITLEEIQQVVERSNEKLLSRLKELLEAQSSLDYEKMKNMF